MVGIHIAELAREELPAIWTIDRAEVIDGVYHHENGGLVLKPEHWDVPGWGPDGAAKYMPLFHRCLDRGGTAYGAFDGERLVGVAILDGQFLEMGNRRLELKFLHVGRSYRKNGLGRVLFEKAVEKAREIGARALYISATPSRNTIDFYRSLGCEVTEEIDPELFTLEPEDIHLEYAIPDSSPRPMR